MSARPAIVLRELLLARCDLESAGGVKVAIGSDTELPFFVPGPNHLFMMSHALCEHDAEVHLRHGLELAWLRSLLPNQPAVCGILAARIAALYRSLLGNAGCQPDESRILCARDFPQRDIARLWTRLQALQGKRSELTTADYAVLDRAWPLAAPVEFFLVSDIDPRLTPDPTTGLNKYGCAPRPQPNVATFSSCTASTISARGFVHAEAERRRILAHLLRSSDALSSRTAAITNALLEYFGVDHCGDLVLASSGTDATRAATDLIRSDDQRLPLTAVLMGLSETGTAVPAAALGQGFDNRLQAIGLRGQNGAMRAAREIEADIDIAVKTGLARGQVALHAIDISKTGVIAPSPQFTVDIARRTGSRLHVIVDACQGRIADDQIRQYLGAGHMVTLTGSKFYSGPAFSGAVLFPRGKYAKQAIAADPATLVRWAAALGEMRAFAEVPAADRAAILGRFGKLARERIRDNPRLVAFPDPALSRPDPTSWDAQQTIFTFGVRDPQYPRRLLGMDALARIYKWLYRDLSERVGSCVASRVCRVGQPVRLGECEHNALSALRIASSARTVSGEPSHVLFRNGASLDREIADMDDVMAKLGLILDHLPELNADDHAVAFARPMRSTASTSASTSRICVR